VEAFVVEVLVAVTAALVASLVQRLLRGFTA
jgi:hypothetical protein